MIDNRFYNYKNNQNHDYNYNNIINQNYNDESHISLKNKIYKTLSQNISISVKGQTYTTTVRTIKIVNLFGRGQRGQITGGGGGGNLSPRNIGTSIGDSLLRNASPTDESNNDKNRRYRSLLNLTTKMDFVDKLKWGLYNSLDLILPNIFKNNNFFNSTRLQNRLIFEWLFYNITNKKLNYETKFFIHIKSFYENKPKNTLDFGLFIKSNKLNKSFITLAFNPIDKNFAIAYSFCVNNSESTTAKNFAKKQISRNNINNINNTNNKKAMPFASMSSPAGNQTSIINEGTSVATTSSINEEPFVAIYINY